MKGIIDYIFRPSTHDPEVVKSIYKGMVRTTRAMVAFAIRVLCLDAHRAFRL